MSINKNLVTLLSLVTSKAAIASFKFVGKKDKNGADKAAVDVMRNELNNIDLDGEIVIGEGELDEAPMLYVGEKVGTGNGISLDIAVDPVEGTNFVANNLPGGMSMLSVARKGDLFNAPETYMEKIAYGSDVPENCIDLDFSVEKNINNLADFKRVKTSDLSVCILDRPRHKKIVDELKRLKVKIKFISDGDVSGALFVSNKKYLVDLFMGVGGGPEGVLAASALDSFNCKFQGRFLFEDEISKNRARKMGIKNFNKKYTIKEIVKGESIFCSTGITNSDIVKGVKFLNNIYETETLVTHKNNSINIVKNKIANT